MCQPGTDIGEFSAAIQYTFNLSGAVIREGDNTIVVSKLEKVFVSRGCCLLISN